ncbi:MAG TPA: TonB-dependent receptor [Steroidobacter sp.]|uniref:TonB-dependent receptor n=1 Tax=Steroidobacter sp. TaxID=1978227 RepID=UPI002EDB7905
MTTNRFCKRATPSIAALSALLSSVGLAQPADDGTDRAETAETAQATPGDTVAEIIVTARKGGRGESVQRIPESIRAFGSQEIESAGLTRIEDVVELTPNIVLQPSYRLGVVNLSARGHSTPQQGDSPIVINFDGVQAPAQDFINQDLFDIERIEVVKGPQPLYGAGAIAGAINIITKQPSNEQQGFAKIRYGNADAVRGVAGFAGPIVNDKVYFRLSGVHQRRDGYIQNTFTGDPVDFLKESAIRGSLHGDFNSVRVDLKGAYTHTEAGASYYESFPLIPDPVPQIDSLFGGRLGRLGSDISDARFENSSSTPTEESREVRTASAKVEVDLADGILTSVTGYNKSTQSDFGDLDFQPADILLQDVRYDVRVFNQELRFASDPGEPFRYVVGGFFQKRKIYNQVVVLLGDFTTGYKTLQAARTNPLNSVLTDGRDDVSSDAFGAFLNVDYDITQRLTLNVVLRYDTIDYQTSYAGENPAFLAMPLASASQTFDQWQPKFNLSYELADDVLAYANYARGFRSGVPNPTAAYAGGLPRFIKPETSDEFEVGVKSSFFDRKLQLNASAFISDIHNRHHYFYGASLQSMTTYQKARVKGMEVELNALLARGLELQVSGGLMSAKIDSHEITQYTDFTTGAVALTVDNRGNVLPDTPERTFNAALLYRTAVSSSLEGTARVSWRYTSRIYFDTENQISDTGGKSFLDLRAGLESSNTGWGATLFMENVTDERTYTNYAYSGGQGNYLPNQPRTYGIELDYRF